MVRYVAAEARASFYEGHSHHYLTLSHTSLAKNVLYQQQIILLGISGDSAVIPVSLPFCIYFCYVLDGRYASMPHMKEPRTTLGYRRE